jgi:prepilin-type N-terminal cleavage/methylation domain-containing protein
VKEENLLTLYYREDKMKNQKGFTFIEIIAVMVIMSMIFIVILPRMYYLSESARKQVVKNITIELGSREMATWIHTHLDYGFKSDEQVFEFGDYQLDGCTWNSIDISGGTLQYEKDVIHLNRRPASFDTPARWSANQF